MKWAIAGSLLACDAWNARVPPQAPISTEAAVRLPNALAGTVTSLALLLLGRELFGPSAGWLTSWFWAIDVRAISVSRVAKEDTFALLFLLLGAWLYERAKAHGRQGRTDLQWRFAVAGVMFGLMLGSKYMPYLFGIHVLYFRYTDPHPGSNRADPLLRSGHSRRPWRS